MTVTGLHQTTWYYGCLEFESFNRQNETTGSQCRLFRTLSKYGKNFEFPIVDVQLNTKTFESLILDLSVDLDHDAKFTFFLQPPTNDENQSIIFTTSKIFMLNSQCKLLKVNFDSLQSNVNHGRFCILHEPVQSGQFYTTMGLLIDLKVERCFLENLTTDRVRFENVKNGVKKNAYFEIDYQQSDKMPQRIIRHNTNGSDRANFSVAFVILMIFVHYLYFLM